ncbi:histidine triad (HIT) family protein [Cruoricaptor ignavus]|uniref:Histidine triad (HIT) family protein n=1 Tax=Cruoricaptor ignavus TaxID=1118202 RepID=A0A1M6H7V7_9FLAO|nr:HIT family protein [Cruoricaptor ignavus]SHJ18173.1 histidine triad (HIT) family protein [Cruoricaptor ignavus]
MSSVFTKIVQGEIPAYKIAEDDKHLAFLDVQPLVKGHTLVIPKREVDLIFDLESEEFKNLWAFAQKVAKQIQAAISCERVGIAVIGLEVPHAHIHLVPLNSMQDLNFGNERLKLSEAEFKEVQERIISDN